MPVPFQDIQITDSISYPDHICDIPPSTVDDGHIPYSNLHSRSSFFFLLIHSICQVVGFYRTLSGTMSAFATLCHLRDISNEYTYVFLNEGIFHIFCVCLIFIGVKLTVTIRVCNANYAYFMWTQKAEEKTLTPEYHRLFRWICFGKLASFVVLTKWMRFFDSLEYKLCFHF